MPNESSKLSMYGLAQAQSHSSDVFLSWLDQACSTLAPAELSALLSSLADIENLSPLPDLGRITPELDKAQQVAILEAISNLLEREALRTAYCLYTTLLNSQLKDPSLIRLSPAAVKDCLLAAARLKQNQNRPTVALQIREFVFELDPYSPENLWSLIDAHSRQQDDFSVGLYAQTLIEALGEKTWNPEDLPEPQSYLIFLLEAGYTTLFIELLTAYVPYLKVEPQAALYAWLSIFSQTYHPEFASSLEGRWQMTDLLYESGLYCIGRYCFKMRQSYGFSIMASALCRLWNQVQTNSIQLKYGGSAELTSLFLRPTAAYYLCLCGRGEEAFQLMYSTLQDWPLARLEAFLNDSENQMQVRILAIETVLYSVCFTASYVMDNRPQVLRYQAWAGSHLHQSTRSRFPQLRWTPPPSQVRETRRLRVGYFSDGLREHSVGFLSHQAIGYHKQEGTVDAYCYLYGQPGYAGSVWATLQARVHRARDLRGAEMTTLVQTVRDDHLDVLVFMDALTNPKGYLALACRLAPIQICWLGGDSTTLPDVNYFFVDPWILPPEAETDYPETLVRLPTFVGLDSLEVAAIEPKAFYQALNISEQTVIFWTAANALKRSPASIEAHLEVIRQVPNSVLIVRGVGDVLAIVEVYQERAREKGVQDQLRFLPLTFTVQEYRAYLGFVDIVLDTFPYTGATHTVEALYRGIPVVTKVGEHYYGRMSYSILKSVELENACTAWTVDEFVQKAVALGQDPVYLQQVKQHIQDSRRWSVLWDARGMARSLEMAYRQCVDHHSQETIHISKGIPHYESAREWNQAGIERAQLASQELSAVARYHRWEEAIDHWRAALKCDPYYLPAWLNQIHGSLVLGDSRRAIPEALTLLQRIQAEPEHFETRLCAPPPQDSLVGWIPEFSPLAAATAHLAYHHHLASWLATHGGVIYRQDVLRFWQLALALNPEDLTARLVVGLVLLHYQQAEGIHHLESVVNLIQEPTVPDHYRHLQARATQALTLARQTWAHQGPRPQPINPVTVDYEGYRLSLEPSLDSVVTVVLLAQGQWFESEIQFCQRYLQPGMGVIDVGANVGVYTFVAARQVGPNGLVLAVEPTRSCLSCLEATIKQNQLGSFVILVGAAAGASEEEVYLVSESATVFNHIVQDPQRSTTPVQVVQQLTLDSLWQEHGRPAIHLLKIDAEGAELSVLHGSMALIEACQPVILFEVLHGQAQTGSESARFLKTLNYRFYTYNRWLHRLSAVDPEVETLRVLNLIAMPASQSPDLG